ncbi:MAG: YHYH protein [Verrucomicrobiaceae bacterium]|nr:MAG: YHYH protein [Verrucomicrobiaceae bacterium]
MAHQAGNQYHYHAQPIALRYQLGDHVDYNSTTNRYTESASPVTRHSPIVAWASDGFPVYGPDGYSSPLDPGSGLRRMTSGYVLRNGQLGTTNLTTTGRTTLPLWASVAQNRSQTLTSAQYGPTVGGIYSLGRYLEDYDHLGDLGRTQGTDFDLDRYNGRFCVTPEFPEGTYAYFSTINANGTVAFPYNIGRQFYGTPQGGAVTSIVEAVTTVFQGGANSEFKTSGLGRDAGTGAVSVTWSSVEGGTYKVAVSNDLNTWSDLQTGISSGGIFTTLTESPASQAGATKRFYRVSRTALSNYDSTGFSGGGNGSTGVVAPGGSAARGSTVTVTITLPTTPPQPPANLVPASVILGGTITGTSISRPTQGTVVATFAIPANAPTGAQNIVVTFNPAPSYTMTGAITILQGTQTTSVRRRR